MTLSIKQSIAALSAALALSACSATQNPVTGQHEHTIMSTAEEQRIGAQEHPKILAEFGGAYNERGEGSYIADLGNKLVANSQIPGQRFTFTLLDSPEVNAFALPGGYVYVTRGMMALANNEAEIAGVIGHEIGHVAGRHAAQRKTRSTVAGLGQLAAVIGATQMGLGADAVQQLGQMGQVAAKGYVSNFSRSQELEADRLGVEYLARAGYNPYALATLLDNMKDQSSLNAQMEGREYNPNKVSFLATHPATGQRYRQSLDAARASGIPIDNTAPLLEEPYMRALDGMIYGDSPAQGYVRGGSYFHPVMGFAFDAPPGWEIKNRADAIGVIGPNDQALAVMDLGSLQNGSLDATLSAMFEGATNVSRPQRTQINGAPAITAVATGSAQGKAARIRYVLIDAGGGKAFRWRMVSTPQRFGTYDPLFERLASSFRPIGPGQAPPPLRIRTRQVQPGETVASLAAQTGFDSAKEARFRVMNGLGPTGGVRPGQWIKLVQ